jgi:hypothetical protein
MYEIGKASCGTMSTPNLMKTGLASSPVIMHSLHKVHKMNTCRAGEFCLPAGMIQLQNCWRDFDKIWYRLNATGVHSKMVHVPWIGQGPLVERSPKEQQRCGVPGAVWCTVW